MMSGRGIYQIRNTTNGHCYIGQARHLDKRRAQHFRGLRHGAGDNSHLQAAWNKHGEGAFVFETLAAIDGPITKRELTDLEQDYVDFFLPTYNILRECVVSTLVYRHTPEARARMSAAGKGNPKSLGRKVSPETKAKLSAAMRGRKLTPEHREKVVAGLIGRHPSPETRAKLSEAKRRYWASRSEAKHGGR